MNKGWTNKKRGRLKLWNALNQKHRKLKSSHHVDFISSTYMNIFSFLCLIVLDLWHFKVLDRLFFLVHTLYFNYTPWLQKLIQTLFCRKIWIYAFVDVRKVLHTRVCSPESFQLFCLWPTHFIVISQVIILQSWIVAQQEMCVGGGSSFNNKSYLGSNLPTKTFFLNNLPGKMESWGTF